MPNPAALAALLVVFSLGSDDPPLRQTVSGRVQRADGGPWSGAEVHLRSLPWAAVPGSGMEDAITVRANDQGLFRAAVLAGRSYSAWAVGPAGVDGRYRASSVQSGVGGGVAVTLRERARDSVRVAVRLLGREAWESEEPLVFTGFCMLDNYVILPCEQRPDGTVLLPRVPAGRYFLRVRTRSGVDVASGSVPVTVAGRERAMVPGAPDPNDRVSRSVAPFRTESVAVTEVELPAPRVFEVALRDDGDGGVLFGARLYRRDRAELRPVAQAGLNGIARVLVPAAWRLQDSRRARYLSFWADAPFRLRGAWVGAHAGRDRAPDERGPDLELRLPIAPLITGRLWWRKGEPAVRAPLLVHSWYASSNGGRFTTQSSGHDGYPVLRWTDGEGRFAIPQQAGMAYQLSLFLRERELRHVRRSAGYPPSPYVILDAMRAQPAEGQELGDVMLDSFVPFDLAVEYQKANPFERVAARYHEARTMSEKRRVKVARADLDWSGRLRLLCRRDHTLQLDLRGPRGQHGELGLHGADARPGEPLRIQLAER